MSKYRHLLQGQPLPQDYLEALEEFLSVLAGNFVLTLASPTAVQVVAGADNNQVTCGINGKWRYISATENAAHPGGPPGQYNIWVTATANVFGTNPTPPPNELDSTNYGFHLQILPLASTPSTAHYRQAGTLTWDGTQITDIRQIIGNSFLPKHADTHDPGGGDVLNYQAIAELMHMAGTLGARPAATPSNKGFLYFATDAAGGTMYRSNGTTWQQQTAGVAHAASHMIEGVDAIDWVGRVNRVGTLAARPAASALNNGSDYLATDLYGGTTFRSNGSVWQPKGAGATASLAPALHADSHKPNAGDALDYSFVHLRGTLGSRPAASAGNRDLFYFAYDTNGGTMYRSTGSIWEKIGRGATELVAATTLLDYSDTSAGQVAITAGTIQTSQSIIATNTISFPETASVIVALAAPEFRVDESGSGADMYVLLYQDGAFVKCVGVFHAAGSGFRSGGTIESERMTVTPGNHSWEFRAFKLGNNGAWVKGNELLGDAAAAPGMKIHTRTIRA
jgi:hypothetical protein